MGHTATTHTSNAFDETLSSKNVRKDAITSLCCSAHHSNNLSQKTVSSVLSQYQANSVSKVCYAAHAHKVVKTDFKTHWSLGEMRFVDVSSQFVSKQWNLAEKRQQLTTPGMQTCSHTMDKLP
jgi:hypothetical protein